MTLNPSIKKVITPAAEGAIASYDYFDIASGTGIKNFYACQSYASGATTHTGFLTTDASIQSDPIAEKVNGGSGLLTSKNYDVAFNLPQIINGDIKITVSQGTYCSQADEQHAYVTMRLYKVSGGTPVQLGDEVTTLTTLGATGISSEQKVVIITVPKTTFKKDDILRLTVEGRGKAVSAGNKATGYGCDPASRDDILTASGAALITAGETTQLKVGVPFVVDVS